LSESARADGHQGSNRYGKNQRTHGVLPELPTPPAFHIIIEFDQIASPGTGFGNMLARAPGRRSAAKLLSEDGTSDRGEYRQAAGATENAIHLALKIPGAVGQAIVSL